MRTLRSEERPPAPGTVAQLLAALDAEGAMPAGGATHRLALVVGVVAGTALGAVGVLVLVQRRRTTC